MKEYNQQNPQGLSIMLYGKKYASISQASRETKHSRVTLSRMLKDPSDQRCLKFDHSQLDLMEEQLEKQRLQAQKLQRVITTRPGKAISVDGVVYESIASAARQLNCNRTTLRRRLAYDEQHCFLV